MSCHTIRPAPMFRWLDACERGGGRGESMRNSPNFRVAHESFAEADGNTVRLKRTIAVVLADAIHVGGVSAHDGVALLDLGHAPPIVHTAANAMSTSLTQTRGGQTHIKQTLLSTLTIVVVVVVVAVRARR
jgi:putative copper export protein